ncbi:MAG: mannosyltransferase family protein [Gaiellaceae bacterium]
MAARATRNPATWIFLWSRVLIWLAAISAFLWFEPNRHPEAGRWDSPLLHQLGYGIDVWARWDSAFFLRIAEHGYDGTSAAFYPLYPAVVAAAGRVLAGQYVLAGVLVSLAACLGAFVLLYRLSEARLGADAARRTVVYLAICPMALFLGAVYSESLYLLLAVAAFALAERGRFLAAGAVVGLAILTRATGVALLPALAVMAWPRRRALLELAVAIPIAAVYPLVLWREVGDPWAFWGAQDLWHRHLSWAGPLGGIWDGVHALWGPTPSGAAPMHASAVNIEGAVALAVCVLLTVVAWRKVGAPYGLFAALSLAIPLSLPSSRWPLLSLPRFALVIFPLFMALAALGARPRAHTFIVAASALFLGVAVTQWALWQWVS